MLYAQIHIFLGTHWVDLFTWFDNVHCKEFFSLRFYPCKGCSLSAWRVNVRGGGYHYRLVNPYCPGSCLSDPGGSCGAPGEGI